MVSYFFSYPSAYFVRQWEHYKADPSQNIIQGTYKEGMSFNTDVVDNMDYQWCNSNIMRYFSVSVSQNNTVTVTFKNAFRYTTKKVFGMIQERFQYTQTMLSRVLFTE